VVDIIIPAEVGRDLIKRTAGQWRFGESGLVEMVSEFEELPAGGGREGRMPFGKDLTGPGRS
jgi:hypothetical protein